MRVAVLQTNPLVGDVETNLKKIMALIHRHRQDADLFVTPELALIGYPPRDLLSLPSLLAEECRAVETLRLFSQELSLGIIVGHTEPSHGTLRPLWNAASLFDSGIRIGQVFKTRIPSYDIFEEERFFESHRASSKQPPLTFRGETLGISICEDQWDSILAHGVRDVRSYSRDPSHLSSRASLSINLSASPYALGKASTRRDLFCSLAARANTPLVYANMAGGQDDILFDGGSLFISQEGVVLQQAARFQEDVLLIDTQNTSQKETLEVSTEEPWQELWEALVLGIRDFVHKCGQSQIVLGLSGGIDSSLVAVLAHEALGASNVLGISLPSRLTSQLSMTAAQQLAVHLGIGFREIPIASLVDDGQLALNISSGLPLENLQSRARGLLLTTLANHEKRLVLATANKSELAMGYGTLYGDLSGALLPIGDLYKTEVYALSHYANRRFVSRGLTPPIADIVLDRPPTAELSPNQKDEDSLPPYAVLDGLLYELIENQGQTRFSEESWNRLLGPTHSVASLRRRVGIQEFKRRQAPPILKVHQRSFGVGWKMPIAKGLLK